MLSSSALATQIPKVTTQDNRSITALYKFKVSNVNVAGGLINDQVLAEAKNQGLADINWDVIPFDWANDANTGATRYMLMTQIKNQDPTNAMDDNQMVAQLAQFSMIEMLQQLTTAMQGSSLAQATALIGT